MLGLLVEVQTSWSSVKVGFHASASLTLGIFPQYALDTKPDGSQGRSKWAVTDNNIVPRLEINPESLVV